MSTRTHLFQIGGAIPVGRLYIERRADAEVVETLADGEFCYVLAPRQIGKSSLRLRAAKKLEQQGIRCVSIDFSGIGSSSVTIDEWYFSIAYEIAEDVRRRDEERLAIQISGGIYAGMDKMHTAPVPEPLIKPAREGRIVDEARQAEPAED